MEMASNLHALSEGFFGDHQLSCANLENGKLLKWL